MTTPAPSGLLRWGQSGRYTGWDDRVVITALSGRRVGVVVPVRMASAGGLTMTLDAHWLAVAPAGDGTTAVITSPIAVAVAVAPGDGIAERTDELRAEIADPDAALWSLSVLPEGVSDSGLVLGWVRVPPDAESAADMHFEPRQQDFSTGGAIPGPPGPIGPEGPMGPPGTSTLVVGSFGAVRTPADLLISPVDTGYIPADWDGPGHPPNDVQVLQGWSLIYEPDSGLWTFVGDQSPNGDPWIHPGFIQGPAGPQGPPGPDPDYGVGPWTTMPNPSTPAGLGPATTVRYRILGSLNCVQFDCTVHIPNAIANAGATWSFGILPVNARPIYYAGQPRIYTALGNMGVPGVGGPGANPGESRLGRFFFNQDTGALEFISNTSSAGVGSWAAILPRPDVSTALPTLAAESQEEVTPHDRPARPARPARPPARRRR